jgi:hypothetical protein
MSTSDPPKSKSTVFLRPEEFTVERVFPIRNIIGDADIPEVIPASTDSVSVTVCDGDRR